MPWLFFNINLTWSVKSTWNTWSLSPSWNTFFSWLLHSPDFFFHFSSLSFLDYFHWCSLTSPAVKCWRAPGLSLSHFPFPPTLTCLIVFHGFTSRLYCIYISSQDFSPKLQSDISNCPRKNSTWCLLSISRWTCPNWAPDIVPSKSLATWNKR